MHARKTGAMIRASAVTGAIMAGATEALLAAIDRYGAEIGLAFQIVDDILDVEGASAELGKTAGKDAAAAKPTYPALYGLERVAAHGAPSASTRALGGARPRGSRRRSCSAIAALGHRPHELTSASVVSWPQ